MDLPDTESVQSDAPAPAYANVPAKSRTGKAGLGRTPLTASLGMAGEHPRVLVCMLATFLAMPLLLVGLGSGGSSKPRFEVQTAAVSYRASAKKVGEARFSPVSDRIAPTTTTTIAPPEPTASSEPATTQGQPSTTEAARAPVTTAPPTTQWQPPATTVPAPTPAPVTEPPATAPPVQMAAPRASESGQASYYNHPGGCAHKTLPFGTVVHITASNGNTASCVVNDRGPFVAGRIIDVDTSTFAQLAPLSAGVVSVTISW